MTVEKDVEAKLIAAITTALSGVSGVAVDGAWQTAASGGVKGVETADQHVRIAVVVGAPQYDTFTTPTANLPVAIAIVIRQETSADGALIASVMGPIEDLLVGYNADDDGQISELSTANFSANGCRMDGGDAPRFDSQKSAWTIARSFTLRGVISST